MNTIGYKQFGALGDGRTNDIEAIRAAHLYANEHGLKVKADDGAVFYISDCDESVPVMTDVDWSGAEIIIDDRNVPVEKRSIYIFEAVRDKAEYDGQINAVPVKYMKNLGITLPENSMVLLTQTEKTAFVRKGVNANKGVQLSDILFVYRDGTIDSDSPVLFDYDALPQVHVIPCEDKPITLKGGTFTTLVQQDIKEGNYYYRGINIRRSNVTIDGIVHYNKGDDMGGAPYTAFLDACLCADLTIKNCLFTPHITYKIRYDGEAPEGKPKTRGTYDCTPEKIVHLTFENCRQTIDILDNRYWGVMGSNHCRGVVIRNCEFSRFDTHTGAYNITIDGCRLGHQCLSVTGWGLLSVTNTELYGHALINLRPDYGSNWDGDAVIRNCKWTPNRGGTLTSFCPVIGGNNEQDHDFGYSCSMPHHITIDGLFIDDSRTEEGGGVCLLGNINPLRISEEYEAAAEYRYGVPETISIRGLTTATGNKPVLSVNEFMYRDVRVEWEN